MELSGKQRKPSVYGGWLSFAGPTMYDLNSLMAPGLGTTLQFAYDINNVGQIIANGVDGRAYLLTPVTSTVPEPGSLALIGRPCKIHRNIQPSDPQRVLRACVAIASAAAQIHSRASRGAKSPLRPKRTIARSSQRML